jgi:hypothetical protein
MFDLEQSIVEWRRQMLAAGIKTPVPLEELESHLREEIGGQIQSGMPEEQAFGIAVKNIGQAGPLKKEFKNAGFLSWLGDDKNTRINRVFALFWLIICGWPSISIGCALISDAVHWVFAGTEQSVGATPGLLTAFIFEVIFVRGLVASIRVIRGKDAEIRTLRFIAVLVLAMLVAQVFKFKTASALGIVQIVIVMASLFLMRPQKDPKTASR